MNHRFANVFAGVLLVWMVWLQAESNNVCIWKVCFGFNAVVAFVVALEPRITGNNPPTESPFFQISPYSPFYQIIDPSPSQKK